MKLSVGDHAPEFDLPDKDDKHHRLKDYKGKWVLIFFYPRDLTPGCTKEACAMRDAKPAFGKLDAVVLGISTDPPKRHEKFAEKHNLNFTLLADESKEVVKAYGVYGKKKFMGREFLGTKRISFLIDPDGVIAKVYEKVKPADHANEVLQDIEDIKNK